MPPQSGTPEEEWINAVEKVQRSSQRVSQPSACTPTQTATKALALDTLEERRARIDMITTYKILHGLLDLSPCQPLETQATTTRDTHTN